MHDDYDAIDQPQLYSIRKMAQGGVSRPLSDKHDQLLAEAMFIPFQGGYFYRIGHTDSS